MIKVVFQYNKVYDYQYRNSYKNKYSGDSKSGKRHGHGEYMFQNGDYYIGNWESDFPSGEGLYIFETNGKINQPTLGYLGTF